MAVYDPKKVLFTIVPITGTPITARQVADGEFITAEYTSEQASMTVGAYGDACHIINNDKSGTFTIVLKQKSPTNSLFTALWKTEMPFAVIVVDNSTGTDLASADSCLFRKVPALKRDATSTVNNEWIIQATKMEIMLTGE